MHRHVLWRGAALTGIVVFAGCPRGGGGDPNIVGPGDTEFTSARQSAVDSVVRQVVGLASALGTLAPLADPRLTDAQFAFGTFGTCPVVSHQQAGTPSLSVQLDYGDGCTSAVTGSGTVRGRVSISPAPSGGTWIFFTNVAVDGRRVSGTLDADVTLNDDGSVTIAATGEIEVDGVGEVQGPIIAEVSADGRLRLDGGESRFDDDEDTFFVTFEELLIDPFEFGNFVPSTGSLTFDDDVFVPIMVMFAERSADDGVVRVIVNTGSPVVFDVPGIP